jgi:hypothetical protein
MKKIIKKEKFLKDKINNCFLKNKIIFLNQFYYYF